MSEPRKPDGLYEKLFTVVAHVNGKEIWTADLRSWTTSERMGSDTTIPPMRQGLAYFLTSLGMHEVDANAIALSKVQKFEQ